MDRGQKLLWFLAGLSTLLIVFQNFGPLREAKLSLSGSRIVKPARLAGFKDAAAASGNCDSSATTPAVIVNLAGLAAGEWVNIRYKNTTDSSAPLIYKNVTLPYRIGDCPNAASGAQVQICAEHGQHYFDIQVASRSGLFGALTFPAPLPCQIDPLPIVLEMRADTR